MKGRPSSTDMAWGAPRSYPRAILHIDGDSFFASCEVAKDPRLRGKPVVTGKERGIVSACTYEAKRRGVKRGMALFEVRKVCPDAIILPSDYETYSLFSNRMYAIVRRYTPTVEEYSIDECFADLTGMRRVHHAPYGKIAGSIKRDLETELGMTFSIGVSATKVLAKVGSKWKKPDGLTLIPLTVAPKYLAKLDTEKIWGIGASTAAYLGKFGVRTALDLARREESWVKEKLAKPYFEIWRELNGEVVFELDCEGRETYQSIQKTKTFTPPSKAASFIFSQLSKNIENACIKARRWDLASPLIYFFLKTQEFKYHGCEIQLSHPTCIPQDIVRVVAEYFPKIYRKGVEYRATGITLAKLQDASTAQLDLFGSVLRSEGMKEIYEQVDRVSRRYGKHSVFLGSSLKAMTPKDSKLPTGQAHGRNQFPERYTELFKGETFRRRIGIPVLGELK